MNLKVLIVIIAVFISTRQQNTIIGLTEISSGYDPYALSSRSKIFNIEPDGKIVKVNGTEYQTSKMVSVSVISRQKEVKCEGAYTSFKSFMTKQTSGLKVGVEINYAGFGAGIGYGRMVEKVHESIENKSQGVGLGQYWEQMYTMTNAPAFMVEKDSIFEMAGKALAANPSSKADQQNQNEFLRSYGTHYISSMIMGGLAKLYTFVNESYSKSTSYEKLTQQISLTVSQSFLKAQASYDAEKVAQGISEDFRKNSQAEIEFNPALNDESCSPQWTCWRGRFKQNPIPVNMTLAYISDLFLKDSPQISEHMRKTINYYLKKAGTFPELPSDVNMMTTDSLIDYVEFPPIQKPKTIEAVAKTFAEIIADWKGRRA